MLSPLNELGRDHVPRYVPTKFEHDLRRITPVKAVTGLCPRMDRQADNLISVYHPFELRSSGGIIISSDNRIIRRVGIINGLQRNMCDFVVSIVPTDDIARLVSRASIPWWCLRIIYLGVIIERCIPGWSLTSVIPPISQISIGHLRQSLNTKLTWPPDFCLLPHR